MKPSPPRLLLASIHDVSPRFEGEIDRLMDLMRSHVGSRLAMLVVPNHWGEAPIVRGSPFATRLRRCADAGAEIFLHGFFHRDDARHAAAGNRFRARFMTAGEGEFLGLNRAEASQRIADGRALLEDVIGRAIDGFVAPAWLCGPATIEALREARIPIAEDHLQVWSPLTGKQLARGPVITWASRSATRLASSLLAATFLRRAPFEVMRIAVHPPDVHHPALLKSIDQTLRVVAQNRAAGRYSDLLAA